MYIKSKYPALVWRAIIVVVGVASLIRGASLMPAGEFFYFFTGLSVLTAVVYFACAIVAAFRSPQKAELPTWAPQFKYLVTIAVLVTFLIAHFLLGGGLGPLGWETIGLHYVVPIMTLLDWLLFDRKGAMRKTDPLIWPLSMVIYFVLVLVMVYVFGMSLGSTLNAGSRFPYPFMDIDALGVPQVALTAVVLVVAFIVLGYILFALDKLLSKLAEKHEA